MPERVNIFAGSHFDRLGHLRRDADWLQRCFEDDRAVLLPVWNDTSLVVTEPVPRAVFVAPGDIPGATPDKGILLGEFGGKICFAIDLGESAKTGEPSMPVGSFRGLRTVGLLFPEKQSALLAYAQAMVLWHRRHRHCGRCGSPSESRDAGHALRCSNSACGQTIFPRIDPAIIVLVEHDEHALLGRQPSWPQGMYSTIAGFVEPGESLEDAVRREVAEEAGVTVGKVVYHSSQPWPFPSSLMLGFSAQTLETTITLNDDELEEARWFSRADIQAGLHSGALRVPPQLSISSRLIAHWYDDDDPGLLAGIIRDVLRQDRNAD